MVNSLMLILSLLFPSSFLFSSMLAVRAGASRVYACEMDATMATMSRDIITTNGMTDRISIINKTSSDLAIPQDIPERLKFLTKISSLSNYHLNTGCVSLSRRQWMQASSGKP